MWVPELVGSVSGPLPWLALASHPMTLVSLGALLPCIYSVCGPPCPGGLSEMQSLRAPLAVHIRTCTLLGSPGSPNGSRDLPRVPLWLHVYEKSRLMLCLLS